MSNETTSARVATIAGRILSAGDPLENGQVTAALITAAVNAGPPNNQIDTARFLADVKAVLGPYMENMMSLAGSCLTQHENGEGGGVVFVPLEIDYEKVCNAITGAIEGGYSPWMHEFRPNDDRLSLGIYQELRAADRVWYDAKEYWLRGGTAKIKYDRAEDPEGAGKGEIVFGKAEIALGLALMGHKASRHFADLMSENDDATTHDVFMQFAVLGDIIYG